MFRLLSLAIAVTLTTVGTASPEHIKLLFPQAFFGDLPLGKGARAWGMGGVGLAVSGDPEASSWNPAALAGIDRPWMTLSFAHSTLDGRPRDIPVMGRPPFGEDLGQIGTRAESTIRAAGTGIDHLALAYPFRISDFDLVGQVSYQRRVPYAFDFAYAYDYRWQAPGSYNYDYSYDAAASGGLDVLTFSAASELLPGVRLGVNVHRWLGGYTVPMHETHDKTYFAWAPWTEERRDELTFDLSGFSLDVGGVFNPWDWLLVGFVYRPGFEIGVEYANTAAYSDSHTGENLTGSATGRGTIVLPDTAGLGLTVRPLEKLMIGIDVVGTLWSDARLRRYSRATSLGDVPAPSTFLFPTMDRPNLWSQKNTSQIHGGAEYVLGVKTLDIPLRFGVFRDELLAFDAEGESQYATGITFGLGLRWRRLAFDLAWVRHDASERYERSSIRTSIRYAVR